jgi:hypothetical protein
MNIWYGIEERRRCLVIVFNEWAKQRKEGTMKERVRNKLITNSICIK